MFRVHINQPNGRTLSLQATSNPIECCKFRTITLRNKLIARLFSWLPTRAKGGSYCWNPINWATMFFFSTCWSKFSALVSNIKHSVGFIWSKQSAKAMCALYMMSDTRVIYFKSHFMTKCTSYYGRTILEQVPQWSFASLSFGTVNWVHWKKPLFLCHSFVCRNDVICTQKASYSYTAGIIAYGPKWILIGVDLPFDFILVNILMSFYSMIMQWDTFNRLNGKCIYIEFSHFNDQSSCFTAQLHSPAHIQGIYWQHFFSMRTAQP